MLREESCSCLGGDIKEAVGCGRHLVSQSRWCLPGRWPCDKTLGLTFLFTFLYGPVLFTLLMCSIKRDFKERSLVTGWKRQKFISHSRDIQKQILQIGGWLSSKWCSGSFHLLALSRLYAQRPNWKYHAGPWIRKSKDPGHSSSTP